MVHIRCYKNKFKSSVISTDQEFIFKWTLTDILLQNQKYNYYITLNVHYGERDITKVLQSIYLRDIVQFLKRHKERQRKIKYFHRFIKGHIEAMPGSQLFQECKVHFNSFKKINQI